MITVRPRGLCNSFAILATLKMLIDIDIAIDIYVQCRPVFFVLRCS